MVCRVGQNDLFSPRDIFRQPSKVWFGHPLLGVILFAVTFALLPLSGLATEPPPLFFEAPPLFTQLADRLHKLNPQAISAAIELVGSKFRGRRLGSLWHRKTATWRAARLMGVGIYRHPVRHHCALP